MRSATIVCRFWGLAFLLVSPALAWGAPVNSAGADTPPIGSDARAVDELPTEPFVPKHDLSEAQADRLEALQLFATGRLKEQKQQLPAALRFYQRAYRRDPAAVSVLKQIIPLAFNLGRSDEAFRYALKLGQADPSDPVLLRQLGVHLAGEGKLTQALRFYEQAWELERGKQAPNTVLLLSQLGKLYLVDDRPVQAAAIYAELIGALDQPEAYRLDNRTRRLALDDAAKTLKLLGVDTGGRGDQAAAFELFGRTFLEAGRLDEAEAALERAQRAKPDQGLHGWYRAQLAAARGEHEAALSAVGDYFKAHRTSHGLEPYELLEQMLGKLDRQDQLIDRLTALVADDPDNDLLKFFLAERYRAADQLDKAEPLYSQLAASKPSLDVYRAQLDLYRRQHNVPALLNNLATSLSQVRMIELLGAEGEAVLADAGLVDEMLALAKQQVAATPPGLNADERAAIAGLALTAKRSEIAAELFESAIAADPPHARELLRRWGLGLLMQDQAAAAAQIFARLPADETPAAKAQRLYHLAGALELDGQSDQALAVAREAAELAEANKEPLEDAYFAIVGRVPWVLFHAKRYDAARQAYTAQLARFENQLDDKGARASAREARLMLSNLAAIQEDLPHAEEWLEQILDEAPDDISAANDLGYIWVDQGKHLERSLRMIQFAVAEAPDNGAYRDSLGWAWYRLGKYDQAVTELNKAIELIEDPDGVILDHLGDALAKSGRTDEARAAWQRAITAFEKEQETQKAQATRDKLEPAAAASP